MMSLAAADAKKIVEGETYGVVMAASCLFFGDATILISSSPRGRFNNKVHGSHTMGFGGGLRSL